MSTKLIQPKSKLTGEPLDLVTHGRSVFMNKGNTVEDVLRELNENVYDQYEKIDNLHNTLLNAYTLNTERTDILWEGKPDGDPVYPDPTTRVGLNYITYATGHTSGVIKFRNGARFDDYDYIDVYTSTCNYERHHVRRFPSSAFQTIGVDRYEASVNMYSLDLLDQLKNSAYLTKQNPMFFECELAAYRNVEGSTEDSLDIYSLSNVILVVSNDISTVRYSARGYATDSSHTIGFYVLKIVGIKYGVDEELEAMRTQNKKTYKLAGEAIRDCYASYNNIVKYFRDGNYPIKLISPDSNIFTLHVDKDGKLFTRNTNTIYNENDDEVVEEETEGDGPIFWV